MPIEDKFESHMTYPGIPLTRWQEAVAHDTNQLAFRPQYISWETSGAAVLVDEHGNSETVTRFQGDGIWARPVQIMATGTTATIVIWD